MCCMAARGHITRSRELSLSNVVRHVIQGRSGAAGMRRRISYYPRDLGRIRRPVYSRACINMRMTPLVRIMRCCRNGATEESRYARCAVRYFYGQRFSVNSYLDVLYSKRISFYFRAFKPLERLDGRINRRESAAISFANHVCYLDF